MRPHNCIKLSAARSPFARIAVTASAMIACLLSPAAAADLDYRTAPSERYGTAYSDPRYADLYGYKVPQPQPYGYPPYARTPVPQEPVYRDERPYAYTPQPYGYAPHGQPLGAPHRNEGPRDDVYAPPRQPYAAPHDPYRTPYRTAPRGPVGRQAGCVPKEAVQRELMADGWHDFHAPEIISREEASIRARRPDGRVYVLRVDRCSGEVLAAAPVNNRWGNPRVYGYQGAPRAY